MTLDFGHKTTYVAECAGMYCLAHATKYTYNYIYIYVCVREKCVLQSYTILWDW